MPTRTCQRALTAYGMIHHITEANRQVHDERPHRGNTAHDDAPVKALQRYENPRRCGR